MILKMKVINTQNSSLPNDFTTRDYYLRSGGQSHPLNVSGGDTTQTLLSDSPLAAGNRTG